MSIAVGYNRQVTIVETVEGEYIGADNTITTDGMNFTAGLTATTVPPVTKYSAFQVAIAGGGTGTIDLTSLPDANGLAAQVDLTGLKPQIVVLRNLATNANSIKIDVGASNGYDGWGAGWEITLQPGDEFVWFGNDNSATTQIGASKCVFDLTGTAAQILEVTIVAG